MNEAEKGKMYFCFYLDWQELTLRVNKSRFPLQNQEPMEQDQEVTRVTTKIETKIDLEVASSARNKGTWQENALKQAATTEDHQGERIATSVKKWLNNVSSTKGLSSTIPSLAVSSSSHQVGKTSSTQD